MPEIQIPSIVITGLQVVLAFTGAFFIALWLSLIVWTFRDARARSRDIFAIMLATLMVVVFGPLGLVLYFLLRPPVTLAELYERSLEEEALLQDLEERPRCPGCSRQVHDKWIICPDCHTTLKKICPNCQNNLHLTWNICPFCGTQVAATPQLDNNRHGPAMRAAATETKRMPVIKRAYSPAVIEQPPLPPHSAETKPQIPQAGPVQEPQPFDSFQVDPADGITTSPADRFRSDRANRLKPNSLDRLGADLRLLFNKLKADLSQFWEKKIS